MPRAFCVSTVQGKKNIETGNSTVEYHSHRVLVGPQEKIDTALAKIKELVQNGAEVLEKT